MREPNKKICVICGRAFLCPPSDKTVTCSPACRSERARRANIARGGADILRTDEMRNRRKAARRQWEADNPEHAALNQQKATEAAMQLPEGQRGPQNRSAKIWHLITPEGTEIVTASLSDWARRNYELFEPGSDDPEASARRIRAGFAALSRVLAGTAPLKQRGLTQYKGWGLASPSIKPTKQNSEEEKGKFKTSEAMRRAVRRYNKEKTIFIGIRLNKKTDADIIEYLGSVDNKHGSIKALIRIGLAELRKERSTNDE